MLTSYSTEISSKAIIDPSLILTSSLSRKGTLPHDVKRTQKASTVDKRGKVLHFLE